MNKEHFDIIMNTKIQLKFDVINFFLKLYFCYRILIHLLKICLYNMFIMYLWTNFALISVCKMIYSIHRNG